MGRMSAELTRIRRQDSQASLENISDIIPNIKAMLENEKTRDLGVDANSKIIKFIKDV